MSTRRRSTTSEGFSTVSSEIPELEETTVVEETPVIEEVAEVVEMVEEVSKEEPETPKLEPKPEKKEEVKVTPVKVVQNPKPVIPTELIRPRRNVPRFVR